MHNTANYGVPQIRKRIIIMGVRKDIEGKEACELYDGVKKTNYDPEMDESQRNGLKRFIDVKDAIGDLPGVEPGQDASTDAFNYPCNNEYLKRIGQKGIHPLMDHICRKHNATDRERFKVMITNHWSMNMPVCLTIVMLFSGGICLQRLYLRTSIKMDFSSYIQMALSYAHSLFEKPLAYSPFQTILYLKARAEKNSNRLAMLCPSCLQRLWQNQ